MNERSQERTIMTKPSFNEIGWVPLTNMNGKMPVRKVIMQLISNGPKAESLPSIKETTTLSNIKKLLTSRAMPTFFDMDLTFTFPYASFKQYILLGDVLDVSVQFLQLVIAFEFHVVRV